MEFHKRHIVVDTDYCTFGIDEYRTAEGYQMPLAHLHVYNWSPSTLRKIQRDWKAYRKNVTCQLFALPSLAVGDDGFAKWERFVRLMGWKPTGQQVLCLDGLERPLYSHTI